MNKTSRIRTLRLLAAGALMLVAGSAVAYSTGPPNGVTGAPGENNCTQCHSTFPVNSGSGMLEITGLPADYTPGDSYDVTVSLSDPAASRWGFELTVLDGAGDSTGAITLDDSGTQTGTAGSRVYVKHRSSGTYPGTTGSASWTFVWEAPAEGTGDVVLYLAGNGADNEGDSINDRIYTTNWQSSELTGVAVGDAPLAMQLLGNAPNPFNPKTDIRFELAQPANVKVTVFAADGRRVATLVDGFYQSGLQSVAWDGRDLNGQTVSSGTYMYVVDADGERQMGRMTLLK